MTQILLIDDTQIIEGIIGGFGTAFSSLLFKRYLKVSMFLAIVLAWMLTWFLRKIIVNVYSEYKKHKKHDGFQFYFNLDWFF
jgi:hypothetical protein